MVKQLIGAVVALFGLGMIGVGLYIFLTQPFVQGDPNGSMVRAILAAVGGFFVILMGWCMIDNQTVDGKPANKQVTAKKKAGGDGSDDAS